MSEKRYRADLRRLWKESRGVRGMSLAISLAGCLNVAAVLLFVWLTKRIVDYAVSPGHDIPVSLVVALVLCLLVELALPMLRRRLETKSMTKYANTLRSKLLLHMLQTKGNRRDGIHNGDAISRMRDDVATLASLTCSTIPGILAVLLQLIGAFIFLVILDSRLAWAVIFIMPVALVVSKVYVKKTRKMTREIREEDAGIQTFLQESLHHRTLLSTLMGSEARVNRFDSMQNRLGSLILGRTDISIFSNVMVTAGFMTGYVVVFLWSAYGLAAGTVSFGMMTAFLQLVAQVQRPVLDLSHRIPSFINASVAIDRVYEVLGLPTEDYSKKPVKEGVPTGLRFSDVSYQYPDGDENVIVNLTHDFKPGSVTAVMGPTGRGKTTLLRLMLGLAEPTSGQACYYLPDGTAQPIGPALRSNIIYVPQGNTLVMGTVRDNLLLADPDATEEDMRRALDTAMAGFVYDLPEGLDTPCFEGGVGFSEGQAQRIAIARGLLKKGSLILLDEPTSALDAETEELFLKRFMSQASGKTVIIVTHRPAVIPYCTDQLTL